MVMLNFKKFTFTPDILVPLCIRISALCIVVTVLLSWPLWFQERVLYDPAPIVPLAALAPGWLNVWLVYIVLTVCCAVFFLPQLRRLCFIPPAIFLFWVAQDELRWQPFLYMYMFGLLAGGAAAAQPTDRDLDPLRYMVVGVYFWAGFYKLNMAFVEGVFPGFVGPFIPFNMAISIAPLVPVMELGTGLMLLIPRLRQYGVLSASFMIVTVLAALGPLGHNWKIIVWPWNVFLYALATVLFWDYKGSLTVPEAWKKRASMLALLLFAALPSLGMIDAWGALPSFKLYCGCTPYARVTFGKQEDLTFLPVAVRDQVDENNSVDTFDITVPLFNVTPASAMPHSDMNLRALQGLCPRLKQPKDATLNVTTLKHFWSAELVESAYPLCPQEKISRK
jgi:hypothetical protein